MTHPHLFLLIVALVVFGCGDMKNSSRVDNGDSMSLSPDYPVVQGRYQMTGEWSVDLPSKFNRRFEEGSLVFWRPGFTIWTNIYGSDNSLGAEERLQGIRDDSSPNSFDELTEFDSNIARYSYRLSEDGSDGRLPAFYCFAVADSGYVMMAIYFDRVDDIDDALKIWRSISKIEERPITK